MKFKYGQEVIITSGVFTGYRGLVDSQIDNEVKVVMYHPIQQVLTFSIFQLK